MRKAVFLAVLVALLSLTLVIIAQDDSGPSLCTDGTWYCPDPEHPAREEWNWACGAYWAQYYADMIKEVPDWCEGPTPPPPPPAEPTPEPTEDQVFDQVFD